MKNRFNLFFVSPAFVSLVLFCATWVFSGCATKPVHEGGFQKAQWETKALIRNLKEQKTQSVNIDIMAIKNDRARLEITALLGFQVASLVMSPKEISYAIYPEKKFYYGRNSESAVARMIGLPLHPMNLTYIAFDEPVRGMGWKCYSDAIGLIARCENAQRAIRVEWKDRNEGQKKVVITAPQFEMQWLFKAPQTEVEFKSETFTLKQPEGFKAIQIN
ncbi:hypothetical protein [Bdellovibrio svalbardensis]|uniref:DUF4292 domain-containing protein n=1 Tax=Bdellovibrio svalbardensis TaxID=2972972 RepID=A0ABT6DD66_9BACT|nr:hypothetical protein [Bdellovibrio svalbardensis]MDG0814738.1 hypothetical protein [Bdellovibrio svalbardensis]